MPRVKIEVGNEGFGRGLTKVSLDAEGGFSVENIRRVRVEKKLPDRITASKVKQVFDTAQASDLFMLPNARTRGLPDEPRYKLDIDGRKFEVWDGDAGLNPKLKQLLSVLRELVSESTNGEVVL